MLELVAFTCSYLIGVGDGTLRAVDFSRLKFSERVDYINLRWKRSLYEAGTFEVQVPLSEYNNSWVAFTVTGEGEQLFGEFTKGSYNTTTKTYSTSGKLATSPARVDVGIILKREFNYSRNGGTVLLSGCMADCICDAEVHIQTPQTASSSVQLALAKAMAECGDNVGINITRLQTSATDNALVPTLDNKDYVADYHVCIIGDKFRGLLKNRGWGIASCIVPGVVSGEYSVALYVRAGRPQATTSSSIPVIGFEVGGVVKEITSVDSSAMRQGYKGWLYKEGTRPETEYSGVTSLTSVLTNPVCYGYIKGNCEDTLGTELEVETLVAQTKANAALALEDYTEEVSVTLEVNNMTSALGIGDIATLHIAAFDKTIGAQVNSIEEVCKDGQLLTNIDFGTGSLTKAQRLVLAMGGRQR